MPNEIGILLQRAWYRELETMNVISPILKLDEISDRLVKLILHYVFSRTFKTNLRWFKDHSVLLK